MILSLSVAVQAQPTATTSAGPSSSRISGCVMCAFCPDPNSKTYYMIGPVAEACGRNEHRSVTWQGPQTIFSPPADDLGRIPVVGIWAPEMHTTRASTTCS